VKVATRCSRGCLLYLKRRHVCRWSSQVDGAERGIRVSFLKVATRLTAPTPFLWAERMSYDRTCNSAIEQVDMSPGVHQDKATARADAENACEKPCHVYTALWLSLCFLCNWITLGMIRFGSGLFNPQTELVHTHYDVPFPPGLQTNSVIHNIRCVGRSGLEPHVQVAILNNHIVFHGTRHPRHRGETHVLVSRCLLRVCA